MYTKLMKGAISCAAFFLCISSLSAQGWVTNGSNRLFPVSSSLSTSGVQIGIGTRTPAAQLHTTGSLRLGNLTPNNAMPRVLVTDTLGNVFYRDAASFGSGAGTAGWSKLGDAGTLPGTHFLGTTDNQRLVFKTNATEQMTILPDGNIGFGTSVPSFKLQIHSNIPNKKLALTGNAPSLLLWGPTETNAPYGAVLGLATGTGNYATTAKTGDLILGPLGNNAIVFNTNINFPGTGLDEKMRIDANGNVGINATTPSARLHVKGNVRFENLPQGTGNTLVVDANGNVFVRPASSLNSIQSNEVQTLKSEIAQLRAELEEVKNMLRLPENNKVVTPSAKGYLAVAIPNPFQSETTVSYTLPKAGVARLTISNVDGKVVKNIALGTPTSGQVVISELGKPGTYVYALVLDGQVIDSKKMTLIK